MSTSLKYARPLCTECCNPSCPGCHEETPEQLAIAVRRPGGCRFYGKNGMFGTLVSTNGNQCGLVTSSHAPCQMEMMGETPDETICPLVAKAAARVHPEANVGH